MADTINLPAIGPVKKGYVWAALAAVTLIVGFAWYKHSQNAASASAATSAASGTAASSAPIDPQTGYPEGSPEDLAALQELEGSYGDVGDEDDIGDTGTGAAGELYYDPADGLYDLTSPYEATTSSTSNTGPGTFTDNAYWTQYAIENVQGYSASDIQTALALYLSGGALTTTQMSIYQAAVAVAGPAPDPPSTPAHLTSGGSGTGTTGGSGSTGTNTAVTVPSVLGDRAVAVAEPKLKSAGLVPRIESASFNSKTENYVVSQTPAPGKQVASGSTVSLNTSTKKP